MRTRRRHGRNLRWNGTYWVGPGDVSYISYQSYAPLPLTPPPISLIPLAPLSPTRPRFWPSLSVLIVGESSWPSSRPTPRRTPRCRRRHCFQSCCFCSLAWVVHYGKNGKFLSKKGPFAISPKGFNISFFQKVKKRDFGWEKNSPWTALFEIILLCFHIFWP